MTATDADTIDTLVGIAPGSPLDAIRARRPQARTHAEASYRALFAPADPGGVTTLERFAMARFVTGLHGESPTSAFYAARLDGAGASPTLRSAIDAEIAAARTQGPWGSYPRGPLSVENTGGVIHRVADANRAALGARLASAFEHTHMLVFHPRDAAPPSLAAMLAAGWTTTDVVTLSQLVAFLSFQIRVVAGLRTLATTL